MFTLGGLPFAAGRARFLDKDPASWEPSAKIHVLVEFPGVRWIKKFLRPWDQRQAELFRCGWRRGRLRRDALCRRVAT